MKQSVEILLEAGELADLRAGRRLVLDVGGHALTLRFAAEAPTTNGAGPPSLPSAPALGPATWTCDLCRMSMRRTSRGAHMRRKHPGAPVPADEGWTCPECGAAFDSTKSKGPHTMMHRRRLGASASPKRQKTAGPGKGHGAPWTCPHCARTMPSNAKGRHLAVRHAHTRRVK